MAHWRAGLVVHALRSILARPQPLAGLPPYRSGPSRDWIKVKNPDSPARRPGAHCDRPPLPATLARSRASGFIWGTGCDGKTVG
jgi:hypothetical protein